ncbi:MAG: glycosyltransferase family 4 protein, partial [Candidatus Methanomethylicia archaeon]
RNSQWKEFKNEDVKGVHTIIIPAYKKLKKILKTKKINLKILDRNLERKILTKKEMNEWFNNIDIYINASLHEGTPNPVLEAMAVGIPIISTDVGIVSEVFGFHQKKFIFKRDIDELVKKLIMLINNPSIYNLISKENLYSIKKFDIKKTILKYKNFFTNTMNKKENILEKSINHMIFEEKLYSLEKIILSKRMKFNFSLFNKLKIGILITKAKNFYDFS